MTAGASAARSSNRKWIVAAVVIAAIIVALLLMRSCVHAMAKPFNYFDAKAAALKNDRAAVLAFVRDQVGTLPYRGDVKGALGTLWNGAGSPEEKLDLGNELVKRCKEAKPFTLDDVAPKRNKGNDDDGKETYTLRITHQMSGSGGEDTKLYDGPIGALVGKPLAVVYPSPGRVALVSGKETLGTAKVVDGDEEDLEFRVKTPTDGDVVETRELWRQDNRVGPNHPDLSDRYDFVVLPTRVTKYVREKEEQILKQKNLKETPEGREYLHLLDYVLESDEELAKVEKKVGVTALFDRPRIILLSRYVAPDQAGGVATTIDLRMNRVAFTTGAKGKKLSDVEQAKLYHAEQVRSYWEAAQEQQFLQKLTQRPCVSAFDVFSRFHDDLPNTPERRLEAAAQAIRTMVQYGGMDGRVVFTAVNPPAVESVMDKGGLVNGAKVEVTRTQGGGVHVASGPIDPKMVEIFNKQKELPAISKGGLNADVQDADDAGALVEAALLGARVKQGHVSAKYVLNADIRTGQESLVVPRSIFTFHWGEGENAVDQRIAVVKNEAGLEFKWRIQSSVRPIGGTRDLDPEAVAGATVHNPWYMAGPSDQKDATSFILSRAVFEKLKSGKGLGLAMQAKYPPDADYKAPREIESKGMLSPAGSGQVAVEVNGRKVELPVLKATYNGQPLAILQDAAWPVGMADRLTSVMTAIRCRVVDQEGRGVAGATVGCVDPMKRFSAETWQDGQFRIPPTVDGRAYGKVKLHVEKNGEVLGDPEVDLTAPGLEVITVKVKVAPKKFLFITRSNRDELEKAPLSEQVKRHAIEALRQHDLVVIPNQMVASATGKTCAFFEMDSQTGYMVGVTEDGMYGSNPWRDAAIDAGKAVWKAREDLTDPVAGPNYAFHMYRGAVTAYWVYCTDRLAVSGHRAAILATLGSMDKWADELDLANATKAGASQLVGDQLASKMAGELQKLVNQGLTKGSGDASEAAFKVGYLGATAFLARQLDDGE